MCSLYDVPEIFKLMLLFRKIWNWCRRNVASPLKRYCKYPYKVYRIESYRRHIPDMEYNLKKKDKINVVFFVMNLSMWKSDHILSLMQDSSRFDPIIVLLPCLQYSKEEAGRELFRMQQHFSMQGACFISVYEEGDESICDIRTRLNPDIVFYQQPYTGVIPAMYEYYNFPQSLVCYIPYDFKTTAFKWGYDNMIQNIAWRLFYPTVLHKNDAERLSYVKGKNVVICGYPTADDFLDRNRKNIDEWKISSSKVKRLIWAPHHSVESYGALNYSTFFLYHNFMLEMAEKYRDSIQIAFRPHPWLLSKLYKHPKWGKQKADAYYKQWEILPNTFLSQGDYIDLFLTSDAMIHDCGSFSVEYHYTLKPVMFLTKPDHLQYESDFGRMAFDIHYKGKSEEDIESFICNVVIKGNDEMHIQRAFFFKNYLLPPHGCTVAENIINSIVE